jgi:hypothetical protein
MIFPHLCGLSNNQAFPSMPVFPELPSVSSHVCPSIHPSMHLVDLVTFSFLIYTQSVGLLGQTSAHHKATTRTQNICMQTPMTRVGFEPTIPAGEDGSCLRSYRHCGLPFILLCDIICNLLFSHHDLRLHLQCFPLCCIFKTFSEILTLFLKHTHSTWFCYIFILKFKFLCSFWVFLSTLQKSQLDCCLSEKYLT